MCGVARKKNAGYFICALKFQVSASWPWRLRKWLLHPHAWSSRSIVALKINNRNHIRTNCWQMLCSVTLPSEMLWSAQICSGCAYHRVSTQLPICGIHGVSKTSTCSHEYNLTIKMHADAPRGCSSTASWCWPECTQVHTDQWWSRMRTTRNKTIIIHTYMTIHSSYARKHTYMHKNTREGLRTCRPWMFEEVQGKHVQQALVHLWILSCAFISNIGCIEIS